MKIFLLSAALFFFFTGCSDNATIVRYNTQDETLPCLRLVVFPPDALITQTLVDMYSFDNNCSYELQASQKNGIMCNSNQNASQKALSNFPHGYIRLDIYKEHKPFYSYYKDLTDTLTQEDIKEGFTRLKNDVHLK